VVHFTSLVQCQSCTGLVNMIADMGKDISTAMHSQSRCPRKPGTFIILLSQRVGDIWFYRKSISEFLASSPYSLLTLQVTTYFFPKNFLPFLPSLAQTRFFVLHTTLFVGRCASPSSTSFRERILRIDLNIHHLEKQLSTESCIPRFPTHILIFHSMSATRYSFPSQHSSH
jgi:hypothetical protein